MSPDGHALKRMQAEIATVANNRLAAFELRQRLVDHTQQLIAERTAIGKELERARLRRRAFAAYKELKK